MDESLTQEYRATAQRLANLYTDCQTRREASYQAGRQAAALELLTLCAEMRGNQRRYVNVQLFINKYFPQLHITRFPDCPKRSLH